MSCELQIRGIKFQFPLETASHSPAFHILDIEPAILIAHTGFTVSKRNAVGLSCRSFCLGNHHGRANCPLDIRRKLCRPPIGNIRKDLAGVKSPGLSLDIQIRRARQQGHLAMGTGLLSRRLSSGIKEHLAVCEGGTALYIFHLCAQCHEPPSLHAG